MYVQLLPCIGNSYRKRDISITIKIKILNAMNTSLYAEYIYTLMCLECKIIQYFDLLTLYTHVCHLIDYETAIMTTKRNFH